MSCNTCKSKNEKLGKAVETKPNVGAKYLLVKIVLFLVATILLTPFIIPILIIVLFRVIVLGHGVDITPLLKHLGQKIFKKDDDVENEEVDLTEDEYELENPHDIIEFKHK